MKPPRSYPSFLLAAALTLAFFAAGLRSEETTNSIKFSDPSKPGKVKILLARGDLRVTAADSPEVTVTSEAKAIGQTAPRKDGLRVISAASSFSLQEKDNVVTLDAMSDAAPGGGDANYVLTVPRNTSVVVQSSWGGDIRCTGIAGDIEINCVNGEVDLEDVAGGVVVSTMNGEINASIRELHANKPLSFASMNGEVQLHVPADAKANLRLRTQNGSVLTDFDENVLVTKTEAAPRTSRKGRTFSMHGLPPEAREAIREAARVTVQVGREAMEAVRDGLEEAERAHADAERDHAQAERDRARAERDRARAERERQRAEEDGEMGIPIPPIPPMPAMPTISGGKLVTGTLNGGGPEISVATMNGDVTLRQLK